MIGHSLGRMESRIKEFTPYCIVRYALNTQDHTKFVFWANGTASRKSGFYAFSIPDGVKSKADIKARQSQIT